MFLKNQQPLNRLIIPSLIFIFLAGQRTGWCNSVSDDTQLIAAYSRYFLPECKENIEYWQKKLSASPKSLRSSYHLATCLFEAGQYLDALTYFQRLETSDRYMANSFYYQAVIYHFKSRPKTGEIYLDNILSRTEGKTLKVNYFKAFVYFQQSRFKKARALLVEILPLLNPQEKTFYYLKALEMVESIDKKPYLIARKKTLALMVETTKYTAEAHSQLRRYLPFGTHSFYSGLRLFSDMSLLKQMVYRFEMKDKPYSFIYQQQGAIGPELTFGLKPGRINKLVSEFTLQIKQRWLWDDQHTLENGLVSTERLENFLGLSFNPRLIFDRISIGCFTDLQWRFLTTSPTMNQGFLLPWLAFRYYDRFRTKIAISRYSYGDRVNFLLTSRSTTIHLGQDVYFPKYKADIYLEFYYASRTFNAALYDHQSPGFLFWFHVSPFPNVYIKPIVHFAYKAFSDFRVRISPDSNKPVDAILNTIKYDLIGSIEYQFLQYFRLKLKGHIIDESPSSNLTADYKTTAFGYSAFIEYTYPQNAPSDPKNYIIEDLRYL